MNEFSFKRGLSQIRARDLPTVRVLIMDALDIKSRKSWHLRLNGDIEPRVSEAQRIEEIFHSYGVFDVWGYDTE